MCDAKFLEEFFLQGKSLSTLFKILKEPNLKFYQSNVLKKISVMLEKGALIQRSQRDEFTIIIAKIDGDTTSCIAVIKQLWTSSRGKMMYI